MAPPCLNSVLIPGWQIYHNDKEDTRGFCVNKGDFLEPFSQDFHLKGSLASQKCENDISGRNIAEDPPKSPKTGGRSDHELIKTSPEN
jgi:hypothetical protein